jgi:uncharacterized protein (TIGR02246 family)
VVIVASALACAAQPLPTKSAPRSEDEKAIQAATTAFVNAYNAGDAKALGDLFTEDAEIIDDDGLGVQGRPAIVEQFTRVFADDPGSKITIRADSLRFIGSEVAKEEGRSTITRAEGGPVETDRYTVLFLKQGGRWLQSYIREHDDPETTAHDHLKELEWMVGEWVDENPGALISTNCRWSDDKNFLLRTYTLRAAGIPPMTGTQRIGWDPITGQLKSWVFDSHGGSSEGLWSRDGNNWLVKLSGPLRNGEIFSETNVFTIVNKDRVRWKSVDRTASGQVVPDIGEFVMVRKPPQPRQGSSKPQ